MKITSAVLVVLAAAATGAMGPDRAATVSAAPLVPFTLHDDFGGDGLGQWASYPPAQDVGYEPSLTPTGLLGAPGGRALMRVVRPSAPGETRLGFIKHVPFVAGPDARVSLQYRLETPGSTATIEVGLAAASGQRFVWRSRATGGAWTTLAVTGQDFVDDAGQRLGDRDAIEAVYVTAAIADASPDVTYRLLLDDVRIAARRDAAFDVKTPTAVAINPWPALVSASGYRAGDTVAITAAAPVRMTSVEARIEHAGTGRVVATQPLYDDGSHGDRLAGDGEWTNNALHTVTPQDAPGLWMATIQGVAEVGTPRRGVRRPVRRSLGGGGSFGEGGGVRHPHVARTTLRFLVHKPSRPHPRLYVEAADREQLTRRTQHARMAALWTQIRERAAAARTSGELSHGGQPFALLDREYLLPSLLGYFDVLNRGRQRVSAGAIVAFVDGDPEAAASAKAALLDVSRWDRWAPPWFEAHGQHTYYPAGQLAAAVSLGYDLLYDSLTPDERRTIRDALIERSILPTWREYVLDNRVMAHTSNWISHTVGGALIAAAAIEGDTTPEEQARIEPAVNGLLLKIESHMAASFLPDGSYGEGISYLEFDLETLGPMLHALERAFGIDYWTRTHVQRSLLYPMSTLADPVAESLDMGDTHPPGGHGIAAVAYRSQDPVVRWYAGRFTPRTIEDFLFFDDSVTPSPPSSPGSRLFADKGNVVFRTGWDTDDAMLLFRAGPTFNHNHSDQGSFLFRAFGETLVSEAGWSDYYKDPHYATYFTQAVGHNTVLVDGDPESQTVADTAQFRALGAHPRITDAVMTDTQDLVSSDLHSVYKGLLAGYTRRLVFMKPHYLLVYDDLRAAETPARFNWLLHLPDRSRASAAGQGARYTGARASLEVRSLLSGARFGLENGRLEYRVFAARTPAPLPALPAYLDLATSAAAMRHTYLVALVPGRTPDAARSLADRMTAVDDPSWRGVIVARGTETDTVLFRVGDAPGLRAHGEWSADASMWTTTVQGDALVQLGGQGILRVARGKQLVVAADRPIAMVARYSSSGTSSDAITASITAGEATRVRLASAVRPGRVEIDGKVIQGRFDRTEGTVAFDVPPGSHSVIVRTSGAR